MEIIVILNNVRSSENVGSIFRTCDAAGVPKIFLTGYTPAPIDRFGRENKRLTKASLGAEKLVEWEKEENLEEAIRKLQNSLSGCSQKCLASLTEASTRNFSAEKYPCISGNTPRKNFIIVGVEQDRKAINYKKIKELVSKDSLLALVFGNEVEGLSKDDLALCDLTAEIPMRGSMVRQAHHPRNFKRGKESLNVAVSAGVVLYELISSQL